uniref:Uncharacterized protein n=1 Tax=Cannabis sativa TaxID=3483 RepID=A0A803QEE9_CANSA
MSVDVTSYHGGDGGGDDPLGLESKAFPRLVGREIALHVPGHFDSWANVPEQYKHLILTKLQHYYEIDNNAKLTAVSLAEMAEKYKTRKNIRLTHFKKYYKTPEDFENAVKNHPDELNEEQWRLICQLFTSPKFIARSKRNTLNRQKMKYPSTQGSITMAEILYKNQNKSYVENRKVCHTKKDMDTFVNEYAKNEREHVKNNYDSRSSTSDSTQVSKIDILRETLGERRDHERGVGRKLKGQSSSQHTQPTITDQPDLKQTIAQLQRQIQVMSQVLLPKERTQMDVEMTDAAPTQPMRPQPSCSHMSGDRFGPSFQPMDFQHPQPQQTPLSFQQLPQQSHVPSFAPLTHEQMVQYQMFQSFIQMMSQWPNNLQVMMQMMMQWPQTSQVSQSWMPQMMPTQQMPQTPQNFQMMPTPQGQQYVQQKSQMMPTLHGQQTSQMMPTSHDQQKSQMMTSSQMPLYFQQMPNLLQACHNTKRFSAARKSMVKIVLASLVYYVWKARNEVLWNQQQWLINTTVKKTQQMSKIRIKGLLPKKAKDEDKAWILMT